MAVRISRMLLIGILIAACGGDDVGNDGATVGGPCVGAGDCDFRCLVGADFPQGTCTVACNTDNDCPDGTFCIDSEGGVCLLGCGLPEDCRGGYNCEGKENRGHGGDSLVCTN